jgi:hypothetical protein
MGTIARGFVMTAIALFTTGCAHKEPPVMSGDRCRAAQTHAAAWALRATWRYGRRACMSLKERSATRANAG